MEVDSLIIKPTSQTKYLAKACSELLQEVVAARAGGAHRNGVRHKRQLPRGDQKRKRCVLFDQCFGIELALFALVVGEASKEYFHDKILGCRHRKDNLVPPEAALQRFRTLAATEIARMCPMGAHQSLTHIINLVVAIVDGR